LVLRGWRRCEVIGDEGGGEVRRSPVSVTSESGGTEETNFIILRTKAIAGDS